MPIQISRKTAVFCFVVFILAAVSAHAETELPRLDRAQDCLKAMDSDTKLKLGATTEEIQTALIEAMEMAADEARTNVFRSSLKEVEEKFKKSQGDSEFLSKLARAFGSVLEISLKKNSTDIVEFYRKMKGSCGAIDAKVDGKIGELEAELVRTIVANTKLISDRSVTREISEKMVSELFLPVPGSGVAAFPFEDISKADLLIRGYVKQKVAQHRERVLKSDGSTAHAGSSAQTPILGKATH
jgi:hypothetical protein